MISHASDRLYMTLEACLEILWYLFRCDSISSNWPWLLVTANAKANKFNKVNEVNDWKSPMKKSIEKSIKKSIEKSIEKVHWRSEWEDCIKKVKEVNEDWEDCKKVQEKSPIKESNKIVQQKSKSPTNKESKILSSTYLGFLSQS